MTGLEAVRRLEIEELYTDYVHCLECGQVFEADDLEQVSVYDDTEEEPRQKKAS